MIATTEAQLLYQYCEQHSDSHSELLAALYRETQLKAMKPRMASGQLQGRILALISKLSRPTYIVEVGTYTGYATLCLAEGLASDGKLVTIEVNPELSYISQKYFDKSPWASQITATIGDALTELQKLPVGMDLVFIDAKKRDYQAYYDLIIDKMKPGGLILADNILWDGKVIDGSTDRTTEAIKAFNSYVHADPRVYNVILPLRDGVNILLKR